MKNRVRAFKDDWYNGEEPMLLRHRLNILVKDGLVKGNEEVDVMLDRLSEIRKELLEFYDLKETDL